MTESDIERFWQWFEQRAATMQSEDAAVVDELHAQLAAIDDSIAVEVAITSAGGLPVREVIISGSGQAAAMQKAKAIVAAAPVDRAWRFIALKPPRGFDFTFDYGGTEVDASRLHFDSMKAAGKPELVGIMIYCPNRLLRSKGITDVMWHVVETGLGEEATRSIAMIKVEPESNRPDGALHIHELSDFVAWHLRRYPPRDPG